MALVYNLEETLSACGSTMQLEMLCCHVPEVTIQFEGLRIQERGDNVTKGEHLDVLTMINLAASPLTIVASMAQRVYKALPVSLLELQAILDSGFEDSVHSRRHQTNTTICISLHFATDSCCHAKLPHLRPRPRPQTQSCRSEHEHPLDSLLQPRKSREPTNPKQSKILQSQLELRPADSAVAVRIKLMEGFVKLANELLVVFQLL